MMKHLAMILAAATFAAASASAGIGDWKSYTAMNSLRGCASSHDSIWAATSGGVFLYKTSDSSFTRFTNSEGLTTNDITAITIDHNGAIWCGQSDGSIDVYSPSTGKWRYVRDIAVSTKSQKAITCFFLSGDSLYIGTAFGVSLFSISRFEFIDTYANFDPKIDDPQVIPPVQAVVRYGKRVFIATAKGIAVSDTNAVNLASPTAWGTNTSVESIRSFAVFNGTLYAAGADGLFLFNGVSSSWSPVAGVPANVSIPVATDSLLVLSLISNVIINDRTVSYSDVFTYSPNGTLHRIDTTIAGLVNGGTLSGGRFVLATASHGLALQNVAAPQWIFTMPNGPAGNTFVSLAFDSKGVLWCGSGRENGSGLYSYNGKTWRNYDTLNTPGFPSNNCFAVTIGPNDSKWVCTWDSGLGLINRQGDFVRKFDSHSPGFTGISGHPEYIVPAQIAADADGNVWTSIYITTNLGKVVWKMSPDSTWEAFSADQTGYNYMLGVLVDRNGTKWFTNALPGFRPAARIVYLNEKLNVAGTSDGWGSISEANGATSSSITSAIEDHDGAIWFGTPDGITVINDPLHPTAVTKVFLGAVRDQEINCITVDPLNNKWIGTSLGVYVVSPDGTSLIDQYSVANSNGKLVDDNVESIAFDPKNGLAYFGTAKGLSAVGIATIAPSADYSQMAVAPNPYRTWEAPFVTISGLADGSTIKILTITGKLVKQFPAQGGGRAFWDGTTDTGEQAASGIYIAVAYNANGGSVGTAKLAVIRR